MKKSIFLSKNIFSKNGSVMIFVLIVITFCVAVAMYINEDATNDFMESANLKNYYQSTIYAATSVKGVRLLLEEDDSKRVDSKDDDWMNIPTIPVDDGFINIIVNPLNARIPINNLLNTHANVKERIKNAFDEFFKKEEINEFNADIITDWMDEDSEPSENGLEDYEYEKNLVKFKTKNAELSTLLELSYFLDYDTFYKIKNYFSAGSNEKYINLNFVDKDTLIYYIPELEPYADDIISKREGKIFTEKSQILRIDPSIGNFYTNIDDFIDVKSSFFYVLIEVNISGNSRYYHALIKRENNLKTNLITFFEGGNEHYY